MMFQQYIFKKALSKLQKGHLDIISSQCVRLRHKSAKCDKCACPKNAIEIGNELRVKEDLCDGCGKCAETCPTGVFSLSAPSKELTRREFFSFLKDKIKDAPGEILNDITKQEQIQLPKIIPKKRMAFLENSSLDSNLPFTDLKVNDKCDGCDLCALFCPTGALSKKETKKRKTIIFNSAYCTKCDLCITVCQQDAISYLDKIDAGLIMSRKARALVHHDLVQCENCGSGFISGSFCQRCEKDKADELLFG